MGFKENLQKKIAQGPQHVFSQKDLKILKNNLSSLFYEVHQYNSYDEAYESSAIRCLRFGAKIKQGSFRDLFLEKMKKNKTSQEKTIEEFSQILNNNT